GWPAPIIDALGAIMRIRGCASTAAWVVVSGGAVKVAVVPAGPASTCSSADVASRMAAGAAASVWLVVGGVVGLESTVPTGPFPGLARDVSSDSLTDSQSRL